MVPEGRQCAAPLARLATLAVARGCLRTLKTLGLGVFSSACGGCGRDDPVVSFPCGTIHSVAFHRLPLSSAICCFQGCVVVLVQRHKIEYSYVIGR